MRKEKFSYLILVAEIAMIIWLHSVKTPDNKQITPANIVNLKTVQPANRSAPSYIQAAHK